MPDSRWFTEQPCTALLCLVLLFCLAIALADQADDDFKLGVSLYRTQRYETAAGSFEQFLQKYPTHPRANFARLYLGLSLNSIERYSEARPRFSEFLKQEPDGGTDLAVAADVFIYLREIGPVLRETARVLTPGGLFAFTVQGHPGERGAVLGADGRYAHGVETVREDAAVAGLTVALLEPAEIRRQNGAGVPGWLVVLAR